MQYYRYTDLSTLTNTYKDSNRNNCFSRPIYFVCIIFNIILFIGVYVQIVCYIFILVTK